MAMKPKPSVDAFLEGANSRADTTAVEDTPAPPLSSDPESMMIEVSAPVPVVQKMFRLRWNIATALKAEASRESSREGRRVTETEIVERLLKKHLKIQ